MKFLNFRADNSREFSEKFAPGVFCKMHPACICNYSGHDSHLLTARPALIEIAKLHTNTQQLILWFPHNSPERHVTQKHETLTDR